MRLNSSGTSGVDGATLASSSLESSRVPRFPRFPLAMTTRALGETSLEFDHRAIAPVETSVDARGTRSTLRARREMGFTMTRSKSCVSLCAQRKTPCEGS